MDPRRDTSVTSRCSQLWLLDEWLKVVYGLWRCLPLPITESEPRQNVSCTPGVWMSTDNGLQGCNVNVKRESGLKSMKAIFISWIWEEAVCDRETKSTDKTWGITQLKQNRNWFPCDHFSQWRVTNLETWSLSCTFCILIQHHEMF